MKQRAKVNAALCLIHDGGHDASAVTRRAREIMRTGADARTAYQESLNEFVAGQPDMTDPLSKALRLVEASDDYTVAQYDTALASYISTGDDSAINALAPMIAADSLALAVREGDITPQDAERGDLSVALGFAPGPAFLETNPQSLPEYDGDGDGYANSSQPSLSGNPTGSITPMARQRLDRERLWQGSVSTRQLSDLGSDAATIREAARQLASQAGRVISEVHSEDW